MSVALVLAAAPVQAAPGGTAVIVVIAPPDANPALTAALNRFKGEAASVGFDVSVVTGSSATGPVAQMEAAARSTTIVATVALVSGGDPRAFDIWFTDRLTGKTVSGHVSAENEAPDRASAVLAVKAVEFLRARMFDFLVARPAPPVVVRAADPLAAPPPPARLEMASHESGSGPRPALRFGISLGLTTLSSLDGLGTTVVPLLRLLYQLGTLSAVRVTVGGGGTHSRVDATGGGATVAEDLAIGEWMVIPGAARVRPTFSLGTGVHRLRAAGIAVAPTAARTESRLYLDVSGSVGVLVNLTRALFFSADVGSYLLFPEPQVLIARMDSGRTGRPGVSAALALEARF